MKMISDHLICIAVFFFKKKICPLTIPFPVETP